jgi:hypothetical protein
MPNNNYKVFFTVSFIYQVNTKKKVSKSFKSDLDINTDNVNCELTNENVHYKWDEYALKTSLNNLNPPSEFNDSKASEKKVFTHRIVNLMNLTEVHKSNLS